MGGLQLAHLIISTFLHIQNVAPMALPQAQTTRMTTKVPQHHSTPSGSFLWPHVGVLHCLLINLDGVTTSHQAEELTTKPD